MTIQATLPVNNNNSNDNPEPNPILQPETTSQNEVEMTEAGPT